MPLSPPPVPTPFSGATTPARGWVQWFQSITAALKNYLGSSTGIGNGAAATITAPQVGTGGGPQNPASVHGFVQVYIGSDTYWVPFFK